jgi:thiamine pyrophosphate-dependent acetolactate synthase large subunit-like protein
MHLTKIKTKLHELIESTNDEKILENLYQQLSDNKEEDWWENLSETQKKELSESEHQYKRGEIVSNEAVLEKIQQWLQK